MKEKNILVIANIATIILTTLFTIAVIFFPNMRNMFFSLAGKYVFHRELTNIRYCTEMLVITVIALELFLIAFFFRKKLTNLFFKDYPLFFFICIISFFVISNIIIISSRSFKGYSNLWDFEDFAIEQYAMSSLHNTNYPPLAVLFFKFLYQFFPQNGTKTYFAYNYLLTLYIFGTALTLFILCSSFFSGTYRKKMLCGCTLFLTGPILFAYQRMNLVLLALIGTLVFVFFYSSKNKYLKEIALISLAVAANIKLFPAVFGALLLKEKKWKEATRTAFYGIVLFVVPIFISNFCTKIQTETKTAETIKHIKNSTTNGISVDTTKTIILANFNETPQESAVIEAELSETSTVSSDINNFVKGVTSFSMGTGLWTISVKAQADKLFKKFSLHSSKTDIVMNILPIICFAVSLFCFFISKRTYQSLLMLTLICILIPPTSVWYYLTFLIIPLLYYFKEPNKTKIDFLVSFLFIPIFAYYNSIFFRPLTAHQSWHINLLWLITIIDIFYSKFSQRHVRTNE